MKTYFIIGYTNEFYYLLSYYYCYILILIKQHIMHYKSTIYMYAIYSFFNT